MALDPSSFPDIESITVTIFEEHPDGTRVVHTFHSLEEIPEHLAPAFGGFARAEPAPAELVSLAS